MIHVKLNNLPGMLKLLLCIFLFSILFGYVSGFIMLDLSTGLYAEGIQENILGNEFNEDYEVLKFKMSERQLHGIIHSHVIVLSILFFILSILLFFTSYPRYLKSFFFIEIFLSIWTTFGGLWILWKGYVWSKYMIVISGIIMHSSVFVIIILLFLNVIKRNDNSLKS